MTDPGAGAGVIRPRLPIRFINGTWPAAGKEFCMGDGHWAIYSTYHANIHVVFCCHQRWWSFICSCWPQVLEHSAWGHFLHLRRLYWCSDENWRLICFGNLIQTLYCSLCGMLRPVVL